MPACSQGQPFGANYNGSYAANGLIGHTGEDWSCGFGSPIKSPFDGVVYKVLTKVKPSNDGSGFTGVFMLVDDGIESFEYLVGHCDPSVVVGQIIKRGEVIGFEANHGTVYSGNVQITLEMQAAGDQRGHHRHNQKRPIRKVSKMTWGNQYLSGGSDLPGSYFDNGYFEIFDYSNGFNGCIDPSKPIFQRDLYLGSSGYDVWCLQRYLKRASYFTAEPTGYFGVITAAALGRFQKDKGISPTLGYFGRITRSVITLPLASNYPL